MDKAIDKDRVAFSTDVLRALGVDVEGIPIIDPVSMGEVSYIKNRVDEIHLHAGLSELRPDMLESMREWLQEILDNWPNRLEEEK